MVAANTRHRMVDGIQAGVDLLTRAGAIVVRKAPRVMGVTSEIWLGQATIVSRVSARE